MDNMGTTEWLILLGAVAVLAFVLARVTKPSRGDDTFGNTPVRTKKTPRPSSVQTLRSESMTLPDDIQAQVDADIRAGKMISAIKTVRDVTRMGLREAKEFVEARSEELSG